jgi:hypothetical protein
MPRDVREILEEQLEKARAMPRTVRLTVALTETEADEVRSRAQCSGKTVSDYIRGKLRVGEVVHVNV